jgi:hypothetical protein
MRHARAEERAVLAEQLPRLPQVAERAPSAWCADAVGRLSTEGLHQRAGGRSHRREVPPGT